MDRRTALKSTLVSTAAAVTGTVVTASPPEGIVAAKFNERGILLNFNEIIQSPSLRRFGSRCFVLTHLQEKDAIFFGETLMWGIVILNFNQYKYTHPACGDITNYEAITIEPHDKSIFLNKRLINRIKITEEEEYTTPEMAFIHKATRVLFETSDNGFQCELMDQSEQFTANGIIKPYPNSMWENEYIASCSKEHIEIIRKQAKLRKKLQKTQAKLTEINKIIAGKK